MMNVKRKNDVCMYVCMDEKRMMDVKRKNKYVNKKE
jgi:hypothetical protein